jgi:hypothetical protein
MAHIPEHILKLKEDHPGQVSIMEWKPVREFKPVSATDLKQVVTWIKDEFVQLLATHNDTDENFRNRMVTGCETIRVFADNYPKMFGLITRREVVFNPRMVAVLMYQVHVLEQLTNGTINEEQAKSFVADSAMNNLLQEAVEQGKLAPEDLQRQTSETPQHPQDKQG